MLKLICYIFNFFARNRALVNALAARGHNMTLISVDIEKNATSNINYLEIENVHEEMGDSSFDIFDLAKMGAFTQATALNDFAIHMCTVMSKSKGFAQLENYPKSFKFDVVLYDMIFGPCLLGFLKKFNHPPLVGVSPFNNPPYTHNLVGGHKYAAYIPHYVLSYDTKMNFFQRSYNTLLNIVDDFNRQHIFLPKIDKVMRSVYKDNDFPYVGELEQSMKIMLINTVPAFDFPQPLPPNVISVGGLQIQSPKPLTDDIKLFIESSEKGSVLFSLGSNIRSDTLTAGLKKTITETFRQLPQYNFLWKYESDAEFDIPKNLMIKPWLPQSDVLAHPNIKVFISHCGLLSSHEASFRGVPIIGMPIFVDQIRNAKRIVSLGTGELISLQNLDVEGFKKIIIKVIETPSYTKKSNELSNFVQATPVKPLDLAVWWIEWVIQNPTASFLRSPTLELGWIRSNSYDLMLAFFLFVVLFGYAMKKLCIFSLRLFHKRSDKKVTNKKIN